MNCTDIEWSECSRSGASGIQLHANAVKDLAPQLVPQTGDFFTITESKNDSGCEPPTPENWKGQHFCGASRVEAAVFAVPGRGA